MTNDQIIVAITTALQTADANGELSNVILVMQASLLHQLPYMTPDQLAQMCAILNIDTSGP